VVLRAALAGSVVVVIAAIVLAIAAFARADDVGVGLFTVQGTSMEPAFCANDRVVHEQYDGEAIERWEVIFFKFPLDPTREFFKRVVALPGETIEVRDGGEIHIDGEPIQGDVYALATANYEVAPLTVPADRYYVLGDSRRNSFDSHAWAQSVQSDEPREVLSTVPREMILGVLPADAKGCPRRDG
jgi:signal peptidase I